MVVLVISPLFSLPSSLSLSVQFWANKISILSWCCRSHPCSFSCWRSRGKWQSRSLLLPLLSHQINKALLVWNIWIQAKWRGTMLTNHLFLHFLPFFCCNWFQPSYPSSTLVVGRIQLDNLFQIWRNISIRILRVHLVSVDSIREKLMQKDSLVNKSKATTSKMRWPTCNNLLVVIKFFMSFCSSN